MSIPIGVWVASVFVAELGFRASGVHLEPSEAGIYASLATGGYALRPNCHCYMNWFPHGWYVHTDELGLRIAGDGTGSHEPHEVVDIVMLGDSQAFGNGLDYEATIAGQFAAMARKSDVSVACAAVGGQLFKNQIEVFERLRDEHGVQAQIVLICLTSRTVAFADRYNVSYVEKGYLLTQPLNAAGKIRLWLGQHSAAFATLRDASHRLLDRDETKKEFLEFYLGGDVVQARVETLVATLDEFIRTSGVNRDQIVLCFFPSSRRSGVDGLARSLEAPWNSARSDVPIQIVTAAAERLGLPLIDTSPALDRVQAEGRSVSLDGDAHYGETTSRYCAQLIWASCDWTELVARAGKSHRSSESASGVGTGRKPRETVRDGGWTSQ